MPAKEPEPRPQVWQVSVNGDSRIVEDLDARRLQKIAKDNDVTWFVVVQTPVMDLNVAMDIYELAAEEMGAEATPMSARKIVEQFNLVDEPI